MSHVEIQDPSTLALRNPIYSRRILSTPYNPPLLATDEKSHLRIFTIPHNPPFPFPLLSFAELVGDQGFQTSCFTPTATSSSSPKAIQT